MSISCIKAGFYFSVGRLYLGYDIYFDIIYEVN